MPEDPRSCGVPRSRGISSSCRMLISVELLAAVHYE
jgi:hypothetical protein